MRSSKIAALARDRSAMARAAANAKAPPENSPKRVFMRGTLFSPVGAYVVWIREISPAGALITSNDRLPSDCDVALQRGPLFAAARIARSNDSGAEVTFYRDLKESDLASAVSPGSP